MIEPTFSSQQPQISHQADDAQAAGLPPVAAPQRYQIRQEIGRGFSSIVYQAQDTLRGRTVALKVLTLGQTLSPERRQDMAERFLREARAISALSHPNIVSIYEVGQAGNGRHFISMELLVGESLRARMDREAPLGPEDAVPIALQVADALEYAHARGIVHRDVKPDNVYVLPDGRVKLMDFGVAHSVSEGTLTQTGTVVGSPAYMSPEQISGLPLSGGSDVFSLGITLAEMLTGHKPFDAPSIPAVMNRILHRPPQIDGVQPRALRKVVEKSLAKTQAARYLSAGAFAEALRRQVMPGLTSALATDTTIMAAPLPRPRPAAPVGGPAVTEMAQEPPSRAALWTFGVAGLALLLGVPFAFSHLSLSSPPVTLASERAAPPQRVAENAPAAQVAHIPAAWARQPVKPRALPHARKEHKTRSAQPVHAAAPVAASVVTASAPKPPTIAPRPIVTHLAVVAPPLAARPAVVAPPLAVHPAMAAHSLPTRPAAAKRRAPVLIAKAPPTAAARPLTPVNAPVVRHTAAVPAASVIHTAQGHALPPRHIWTVLAQRPWHAPHSAQTRIAAALPTPTLLPRRIETRPPVVRVEASRQEQHLTPAAPAPHPAPVFVTPPPRPAVIPNGPPRLLRRPAPAYPDNLRTSGIGGSVLLRISVNAQGTVTEAIVVRSSGTDDLDAAALDAVGHWFYEPAYQDGHAVPADTAARIDFHP